MKTAVLHDWILRFSIEEVILQKILGELPQSSLFTLQVDDSTVLEKLNYIKLFKSKISFSEKTIWKNIHRFQQELEKFSLEEFEVIFTNSVGPLRWIKTQKRKELKTGPVQIAYLHEPYPFIYLDWEEVQDRIQIGSFWSKFSQGDLEDFKKNDLAYAQGIDLALTNSLMMQSKIRNLYGIEAHVLHPPVNKSVFLPKEGAQKKHFLVCSYIEPGYNLEVLLNSFNYIKDKLVIIGGGSQKQKLELASRGNIHWIGEVDDFTRANYIAEAHAVINTDIEHYHHIVRESAAMGVPIICHKESAGFENIEEGVTGLSYTENTADGLLPAIFKFKETNFNDEALSQRSTETLAYSFSSNLHRLLEL